MGFYSRVIFPFFLDFAMAVEVIDPHRQELLKAASGNILEIGMGTGINLRFYPSSVNEVTTVEPNAGMKSYINKKEVKKHSPQVRLVEGTAEALPFSEGTFDTVVSTFTLCSIKNVEKALSEIQRVLKSGGRFVFLEHGLAPHPATARWQNRLNRVWGHLADGCHLNRDAEDLVHHSGLKLQSLEKFFLAGYPRVLSFMYKGTALKS